MFEIVEDKTLQEVQAKSAADITDAMFKVNVNPMLHLTPTVELRHPTYQENIAEILELTKRVEKLIDKLQTQYADHRANLDEAKRFAGDIIENIEGHQRDVKVGAE